MAFSKSFWSTLLGSALVLQVAAQNANVTSAVDYTITAYGVNGSGCAPGTASASIIGGGKDLSVRYSEFTAKDGPSTPIDDVRKNCQFTVTVKTPAGYQFAFDRFSYDGTYSVAQNVKALYQTYYYFQAQTAQVTGGSTVVGPAKDDCPLSSSYNGLVWSACGGTNIVNINTSIRIDNSDNTGGSGAISVKSTPSISNFVWRQC